MSSRVYSFSVRQRDEATKKVVEELQQYCIKNGIKFNFLIAMALTRYKKEVIDEK